MRLLLDSFHGLLHLLHPDLLDMERFHGFEVIEGASSEQSKYEVEMAQMGKNPRPCEISLEGGE
jgi:hypothetical protein